MALTIVMLSTEHLTPGVYHYRINSQNQFQLNGKLVIIR